MNEQEQKEFDHLKNKILILEREIEDLKRIILSFHNENTPSSKLQKRNKPPFSGVRFPGKPLGGSGGGIKLPEPDETQEHTLDTCPHCNSGSLLLEQFLNKKVLDFPKKPIICTMHRIGRYRCTSCNQVHFAYPLNNHHYGERIVAFSNMCKAKGLSFEGIASLFQQLGAPSISSSTILSFVNKASSQLESEKQTQVSNLANAVLVHKDETSFRKDGKNGWVWVRCNDKNVQFLVEENRSGLVASKIRENAQISVTDGYQAYSDDKIRQLCWAHLHRKARRYSEEYPEIADQYDRLKILFGRVKEQSEGPPHQTQFENAKFELDDICAILRARSGGKKLATYIRNGGDMWLTALKYPNVPLTNNLAERMLRPLVVLRKMMGCYRNEKGIRFIENVVSVLLTWKLQELNAFQMLTSRVT
jgi:hypothetical protein